MLQGQKEHWKSNQHENVQKLSLTTVVLGPIKRHQKEYTNPLNGSTV